MTATPPLIITGMARSGTSAATRLLHSAGLYVGDELIAHNENNRLGYFEDAELNRFNRELAKIGLGDQSDLRPNWMYADRIDPSRLEPLRGRALELVRTRAAHGRAWGFKDPRTAMLLPFWDGVAPEARYLFVYRTPWEVVDSMLRLHGRPLAGRADLVVDTWLKYNGAILEFLARHRDRCRLVHVAAVMGAPQAVVERANGLLADIDAPALGAPDRAAIDAELLTTLSDGHPLAEVLRAGFPEVDSVYARLEREADLASSAPIAFGPAETVDPPRVARGSGDIPLDLVVVGEGGKPLQNVRQDVLLPPEPSVGAAANAGVAATDSELVAVGFGSAPDPKALAIAADAMEARRGRAVAIRSGPLDGAEPEPLHLPTLLRGAVDVHAIVLRRSMLQPLGGFDDALPPAGLDGWAAAVSLAASGVALVHLGGGRDDAESEQPPRAMLERARQHVAERHAAFFAHHFGTVRSDLDIHAGNLLRARDEVARERDEAESRARDAEGALHDVEGALRSRSA